MTETPNNCRMGRRVCEPRDTTEFVHCMARHHAPSSRLSAEANLRHDAFLRQTDGTPGVPCKTSVALFTFLTNRTRDHRAIASLARDCGGVFVPLPEPARAEDEDVHQAALEAVREFGEDSGLIARAMADGRISAEEADAIDSDIGQTIAALIRLKAVVRAKVTGRPVAVRSLA